MREEGWIRKRGEGQKKRGALGTGLQKVLDETWVISL